jgi:hypothetical protein
VSKEVSVKTNGTPPQKDPLTQQEPVPQEDLLLQKRLSSQGTMKEESTFPPDLDQGTKLPLSSRPTTSQVDQSKEVEALEQIEPPNQTNWDWKE